MTDYEFTDKLAITLILWDGDRRDEVYVTIHPVFIAGEPTFKTYRDHIVRDEPGPAITELSLTPETIGQLVAGLRAHTYAERRATVRPRPRDHTERRGRRSGPCIECLATGWIVIRKGRRRPVPGRPELWGPRPLRWQPCPRCLDHGAQAA